MHSHDKYTIANVPEPQQGNQLRFSIGDDNYLIDPERDRFWLYKDRPSTRTMSPLVTFERRADGAWEAHDVNGADRYEGATHTEMLRKVIAAY